MPNDKPPEHTTPEQPLVFKVGDGPWQMRVPLIIPGTSVYAATRDIVLPQELQAYYDALARAKP